jgi:hypothetical protein
MILIVYIAFTIAVGYLISDNKLENKEKILSTLLILNIQYCLDNHYDSLWIADFS